MLAALIAAVRDAEDASGLVATLPVAGRTLIERQVRLAAGAGASHIVVLVERVPAALTHAVDRLRGDGIAVEIARSAGDGADRFHPDERVMVFADGALAAPALLARIAAVPAPALLTIGEGGAPGAFERIDAGTRWSGIALVSGDLLRRTVAMLGEWDLCSTLLRRAAAAAARRLDIADGADIGQSQSALLVRGRADARTATRASLARDTRGEGWPMRMVYGPLARRVVPMILDRSVRARWLRWGGIVAAGLAVLPAWRGWLLAAILLLIAGAASDAVGRLLGAIRLTPARAVDRIGRARTAVGGLALFAFAVHCTDVGWTPPLLAGVTLLATAAAARERRSLMRFTGGTAPGWIADPDALVLVFALAAAAGWPLIGLAVLAGYAVLSFGAVQDRLARSPA